MSIVFEPSLAKGTVTAPPSKSMAHRFLIFAAMADGRSVIENVSFSEDILATIDCIEAIGAKVNI
ncbi:MAG: 3-phosphoshikimate 1-carboxyvinyltransferase, partial [Lachnospiraceae bacterium]|nr:3-phosphoshikimate 1-carboxyvinyltransferase [Lachnospiraceae bacterium]